jgi:hypothetical protein
MDDKQRKNRLEYLTLVKINVPFCILDILAV